MRFENFVLPLVIQQNLWISDSMLSTPIDNLVTNHLRNDPGDHPPFLYPIDWPRHFSLEENN